MCAAALRLVWPPKERLAPKPGRVIVLAGAAGMGKSTVAAALAGQILRLNERVVLVDTTDAQRCRAALQEYRVGDVSISHWATGVHALGLPRQDVHACRGDEAAGLIRREAAAGGTVLVDLDTFAMWPIRRILETADLVLMPYRLGEGKPERHASWHRDLCDRGARRVVSLINGMHPRMSVKAARAEVAAAKVFTMIPYLGEHIAFRRSLLDAQAIAFSRFDRMPRDEIARLWTWIAARVRSQPSW